MNTSPEPRYRTRLARNTAEIRRTQQLRYRVFGEELGAELNRDLPGHDSDRFDPHCWHLMVTDGDRVVACTRLLDSRGAARAGGFYSAGEFDLQMLASLPGAVLEVGRTCVDPAYRNGGVISALWSGIAGLVRERQVDYLFGCASIGLEDGGANAHGILERVRARHLSPERQRVRPLRPMPAADGTVVERPTMCRAAAPWPRRRWHVGGCAACCRCSASGSGSRARRSTAPPCAWPTTSAGSTSP